PAFQHGQHRQRESRSLTGAGLCNSQDVATCEHVGNCLFLDRSGSLVTSRSNGGNDLFGQAEIGKRHKPSKTADHIFGLSEIRAQRSNLPCWVPATYDRLAQSQPESPARSAAS